MLAASLNSALGRAGLMLTLAAATFGAAATIYGIRRRDAKALRAAPLYAWLCVAGAVVAVTMMQRALVTRDFSLAYVQQGRWIEAANEMLDSAWARQVGKRATRLAWMMSKGEWHEDVRS